MLTLADAIKDGRLEDFITQAEAGHIGPIEPDQFEAAVARIVKAPLPVDQTSRSPGRGGSPGK